MKDLTYIMTHEEERQAELARIAGELTGAMLAEGLNSSDPALRGAAIATRNILIDQWELLAGRAFTWGQIAANAFVEGYKDRLRRASLDRILRNIANPGPTSGGNRQHGGPVQAGQSYIVGEKQPELFVPNQNGRILPSVPTASPSAWGGGGITININGSYMGPAGLRALHADIEQAVRQGVRGAGWQVAR
jgi:hypothetical protein